MMNPNPHNQDLSENKQLNLRSTNITLVSLAALFLGLRFLSRWKKRTYIGLDDCFISLAYIFLLGLMSIGLLMIHNGLGLHAAALSIPQLTTVGKSLLAFECIYVATVAFTKISLLLMYCRIFPVRSMYCSSWILGTISVCWAISIIVVCIFQCTPIAKAWDPMLDGHCINLKGSFIGNAVPNILTDVAILTLPMPHVWHLKTTVTQRLQLSALFLLGSFVIFTSIYRFTTLFAFVPADLTWTLAKSCTWCIVESSAGIISACLPTLAPLLRSTNFRPWRKNDSDPISTRSVKEIITMSGSAGTQSGMNKNFEQLDEGVLRRGELQIGQGNMIAGSGLVRVDEEIGEIGARCGDDILLRSIKKKTYVNWSEEGE